MKMYRRRQILIIITLVVAVLGLGVGFAAFSATLNISSSANVSPNSDDFKVQFSTTEYAVDTTNSSCKIIEGMGTNGGIGGIGCVKSNSISDMAIVFTQPGQSVDFRIYIHNTGQYDAYLRGISFTALDSGTYKKCSATTTDDTKATDSLVQAACEGIEVTISIGGTQYDLGSNISGHKLSKGGVEEVQVKIEYKSGSALADGPFKVEISDFKLDYSSVDSANLISFTIDGTSYQAEEGTTWQEWYTSDYNTSPVYQEQNYLCSNDLTNVRIGDLDDFIIGGTGYPTSTERPCK